MERLYVIIQRAHDMDIILYYLQWSAQHLDTLSGRQTNWYVQAYLRLPHYSERLNVKLPLSIGEKKTAKTSEDAHTL